MMQCPVCKTYNIEKIKGFNSAKIDDSFIYENIIVMECNSCHHIFNLLHRNDISNLCEYYKHEYANNNYTSTKYEEKKSFCNYTFDEKKSYIINQNNLNRYIADLINLNITDLEYHLDNDFIALEHFLEHCWNLNRVISNVKKQLKQNGHIYISVPDQSGYGENPYPYLIKEHIQHFSRSQIVWLFKQHEFEIIASNRYELDLLNGKVKLPSIEFLFQLKSECNFNRDGVYCYGIGREFFYIYENNFKTKKIISGLIDDTPSKINKTVDGLNIYGSNIIPQLSEKSSIIITSWYHREEMTDKLKQMDYKGNFLGDDYEKYIY